MKKEKIDVISWRRNISFMCKYGGEKKWTMIMRRFFLEGDEKRKRKGEYNFDENIFGGGDEEERRKERKVCSMRDHSNNFK